MWKGCKRRHFHTRCQKFFSEKLSRENGVSLRKPSEKQNKRTVKILRNYNKKLRVKSQHQENKRQKSMSSNIKIIIVDNRQMYQCKKCPETSKRRYNVQRHYQRFHEKLMLPKKCCSYKFDTKSDFYIHREKIHNEKKKYTKELNKNISKVKQQGTTEFSVGFSKIQNNNKISRLNDTSRVPKKTFLYKWQKDSSQENREPSTNNTNKNTSENPEPLTSNTNKNTSGNTSRRSLMKPKKESITKCETHSSSLNKENIKIQKFTIRSEEDIVEILNSIDF